MLPFSSCDVLTNTVLAPVVNIHSIPGASTFFVEHRHNMSTVLVIHISNLVFLFGYDCWSDFSTSRRRAKLASSDRGKRLEELILDVKTNLNLL